ASGATFESAARLANYAGGIVVMKRGTATVSADELRRAVKSDAVVSGSTGTGVVSGFSRTKDKGRARG
ncbi:MAG TPA: hypothetical protein VIR54_28185, partial [Vicinamibacterales bacterium]